jgi:hypothetical protein
MVFKGLLAATAALALAGAAHAATTFDFVFGQSGVLLGTGVFTTSANLTTPGLYTLSSLPSYSMSYSFTDGSTFTTSDIATPADGVAIDVSLGGPTGLAMLWTEVPGSPDADGGPFSDALDLVTGPLGLGGAYLSFTSPNGGLPGFSEAASVETNPNSGVYVAFLAPAPEPATWAMMIVGLAAVGVALRRRAVLALA